MTKTRILLMSNLDTELGDPYFRLGAFKKYLLPFANILSRGDEFEPRFLLNLHIFEALRNSPDGQGLSQKNSIICDASTEEHARFGRVMTQSYNSLPEAVFDEALEYVHRLIGNWKPDVILCWEAPTAIFRAAFPEALVVELMPSMFARPPYPQAISIDPVGLYKDSWFGTSVSAISDVKPSHIAMVEDLREFYLSHFNRMGCEARFRELLAIPPGRSVSLAPLQVSGYFGFRENCDFVNQYDFLDAVARNSNGESVIATQYVGGFVSDRALNENNFQYLRNHVGDVRYHRDLEKIDSVSQFIVPWVDKVYSVSSTLGLQAKLLGKTLISPSRSHLQFVADHVDIGYQGPAKSQDRLLAAYVTRGMALNVRLASEKGYFAAILADMLERKKQGATGSELLPSATIVDNSFSAFASNSNVRRSVENLSRIFPSVSISGQSSFAPQVVAKAMTAPAVKVISFDIFDTLVRRTVYKPEDVFAMMQRILQKSDILPPFAVSRFAEMRQASERLVRKKRDTELAKAGCTLAEEITIDEVYREFEACLGLDSLNITELVKLEQDVELSVLRPRQVGRNMYNEALANGKRIVITSDFIHPRDFINRVLKQCGYEGYERLFLSSELGPKKHSGALFDVVVKDCGVRPDEVLHIGDNPEGDLKKARDKKLRAILIPSGRTYLKEIFKRRGISEAALDKSFYLRTAAGLYTNEFLHRVSQNEVRNAGSADTNGDLISTHEEFGFLVLGPLALAFAQWILDASTRSSCDQIVFFARDCHLVYKACERILATRTDLGHITLVYAPTSRKSVTGFDLRVPEDVLNVRIDDFTAAGTLAQLLSERFLVSSDLVDKDLMKKWGLADLLIEKRHVTSALIYGLVLDVAKRKWDSLSKLYEMRRQNFADYLRETTPVDFSARTAAVDFGYQGSIHRKIAPLFDNGIKPLFFMTYGDGFGLSPIDDAECFYAENCIPMAKANVCVTHNLLLETLMNEGVGSAVEVIRTANDELSLLRDSSVSSEHSSAIKSMHSGAVHFCDQWLTDCGALHNHGRAERDAAVYFFSLIAKKPSFTEVKLLSPLVFDNAFAGVQSSKLVEKASFWPEANALLNNPKTAPKPPSATRNPSVTKAVAPSHSVGYAAFHGTIKPIVRPIVGRLGNRKDVEKFDANPAGFFAGLNNPWYRLAGRVLFPPRRK